MAIRVFLLLPAPPNGPIDPSKGAIELQSFSWGTENQGSLGSGGGGAGSGKAVFQPLVVVKRPDSASPALFNAVATGKHFPNAAIVVMDGARQAARYDFDTVLPTRFLTTGSQGEQPLEEISLLYGAVVLR